MTLPHPLSIGVYGEKDAHRPTETAVGPHGDIYVAAGYGHRRLIGRQHDRDSARPLHRAHVPPRRQRHLVAVPDSPGDPLDRRADPDRRRAAGCARQLRSVGGDRSAQLPAARPLLLHGDDRRCRAGAGAGHQLGVRRRRDRARTRPRRALPFAPPTCAWPARETCSPSSSARERRSRLRDCSRASARSPAPRSRTRSG